MVDQAERGDGRDEAEQSAVRAWIGAKWAWLTGLKCWEERARRSPFITDVFWRPSVGVLGGWIIGALLGFVIWLTLAYAPGAAEAAQACHDQRIEDGHTISPETGLTTILVVAVLSLLIGWEDILRRLLTRFGLWRRASSNGLWRSPRLFLLRLVIRLPSILLSFADYALARGAATLAGATLGWWGWRYGALALWMGATATAAWMLTPQILEASGLPRALGLWASLLGAALVLGVVRRWS